MVLLSSVAWIHEISGFLPPASVGSLTGVVVLNMYGRRWYYFLVSHAFARCQVSCPSLRLVISLESS
jgi:hypothetical protein